MLYRGDRDGVSGRPNRSATEPAESKSVKRPHMTRLSPHAPAAFDVLVQELKGLALDVELVGQEQTSTVADIKKEHISSGSEAAETKHEAPARSRS